MKKKTYVVFSTVMLIILFVYLIINMGLIIMSYNQATNTCLEIIKKQEHINNQLDNIQNQLDESHEDIQIIKKKLKSIEESK